MSNKRKINTLEAYFEKRRTTPCFEGQEIENISNEAEPEASSASTFVDIPAHPSDIGNFVGKEVNF